MRLLLFNPDNDLALAANDPHYTPPATALQMARDLAGLPRLWAEAGDVCGLHQDVRLQDCDAVLPWGWSPLLVSRLRRVGIAESLLPTPEQMDEYRACSSRQMSVRLLSELRRMLAGHRLLAGTSEWCVTEEEVWAAHARNGESLLKAPWSGSGRGLHPAHHGIPDEKSRAWVRRTLARQGGVEAEPIYNKVYDLAMEFWVEPASVAAGERVRYEGLSLFHTTPGGVYKGNLLAAEAVKERRLAAWTGAAVLHEVREALLVLLAREGLASWYCGPVGIDMMVVQTAEGIRLHPLVELNHRMTMGWVACRLSRGMREGEVSHFSIVQEQGHYAAMIGDKKVHYNVEST